MANPRKRFSIIAVAGGPALALALTAAPANLTIDDGQITIDQSTALAKGNGGGNNNGNGGNNGGGKDKSDRGGGKGQAKSGNGPNFVPGQAKKAAKARYDAVLARGVPNHAKAKGKDRDVGAEQYELTYAEAEALTKHGWGARKHELDDGFRNHGERVNFYKDLAEALGLPSHFGPMWANFGDPIENRVLPLQAALNEAQDDSEAAALQAELDAAIVNAKPGNGPKSGWETVDIDLNDDGIVDEKDLEFALAAAGETGGTVETEGGEARQSDDSAE